MLKYAEVCKSAKNVGTPVGGSQKPVSIGIKPEINEPVRYTVPQIKPKNGSGLYRSVAIMNSLPEAEKAEVIRRLQEYRHRAGTDTPEYVGGQLLKFNPGATYWQKPEVGTNANALYRAMVQKMENAKKIERSR